MRSPTFRLLLLLGCGGIGCASSDSSPELYSSGESARYESKAVVDRAERLRKKKAFDDRLAKLRAAEEARVLERVASSTVGASTPSPDLSPQARVQDPPQNDAFGLSLNPDPADFAGSSVRGLRPGSKGGSSRPRRPEMELQSANCLLFQDGRELRQLWVEKRRGSKVNSEGLRAMEGVFMHIAALRSRLQAELQHRGQKVSEPPQACRLPEVMEGVPRFRKMLGPPPSQEGRVQAYRQGLERLRSEFQIRALLPGSE